MMDLKSIIFAVVFGLASLYLNEWIISIPWIIVTCTTTLVFKQGLSTKALKKKVFQWILEQKQERNLPIVEKCNVYGQSAAEIGTIHRKEDFILELPQNDENELVLHMGDDDGSWLVLKLTILENQKLAKVDLIWYVENVVYQMVQASEFCPIEINHNSMKTGYVHLTILEPLRRLRILFNGIMKNTATGEYIPVRMNLIWAAMSPPFDWHKDVDFWQFSHSVIEADLDTSLQKLLDLSRELHQNGFDQYGVLYGTVVQQDKETELYMRGLRERILQKNSHKKVVFYGMSSHGFNFVINLHDRISYCNGHIFIPGCAKYSLSQIEIPNVSYIFDLVSQKAYNSPQFFIRCKGGNRWFNIGIQPVKCITKDVIVSEMTFNCHRGYCLITKQNPLQNAPMDDVPCIASKIHLDTEEDKLVLGLTSRAAWHDSVSGGKASSLAQMVQMQLREAQIPQGIVVTTMAFNKHLSQNLDLKLKLEALEDLSHRVSAKIAQKSELESFCESVVKSFAKAQLSHELQEMIFEELSNLFPEDFENRRFAVRSSAVGEDSDELSSAGQNETILGCKGLPSILEAIQRCWGSLFSSLSVEYRRQNGQQIFGPMGVVIQEMVAAESAGVIFSRDPLSGDPSKIIITANYGLGESVVSGKADPDTITIQNTFWNLDTPLRILSKTGGSKSTKIVMTESGTTEEVSVAVSDTFVLCITDAMALRLAKLAIVLEQKFGNARDIEFAVQNDQIFLLQSRPVTSFSTWTDYDLQHEFDSAFVSKLEVNSKGNVGEVLPGATCTLSNFIVLNALDGAMNMGIQKVPGNKQEYDPYGRKCIKVTSHHIIFNFLRTVLQSMESKELKKALIAVDYAVFGHPVTKQSYVDTAVEQRGIEPIWLRILRYIHVFKIVYDAYQLNKKGFPDFFQNSIPNFQDLKTVDLYNVLTEKVGYEYLQVTRIHILASEASSTLCIVVFMAASNEGLEFDTDLCVDLVELMISPDQDVLSAGVPHELRKLAGKINQIEENDNFFAKSPADADQFLRTHPGISADYLAFLGNFGHRCLREFDLDSIPWQEDTEPLILTLRAIAKSQNLVDPSAEKFRNLTLEQRLEQTKRPLSEDVKKKLKFLLPYVYKAVSLRENCKSQLIAKSHQLRLAYRKLSQLLCQEGRLPDPDLIWHLSHQEIGELIHHRNPVLLQKASRRRKLRKSTWDDLRFPEMILGVPKPMSNTSDTLNVSDTIKGTPVCRGKYTGVARVVTKLSDAKNILQGDVLITISTDIGWSPYFPLLGGVVTELGGLISHGAVVAREYGLPCVVGAEGATTAFKSGDYVAIDGGLGTVSKFVTKE